MREPQTILVYGDRDDETLLRLKCSLLKCGVWNFFTGRLDPGHRCVPPDDERVGLFIISRASVSSVEMQSIYAEARRLAIPVLQI